MRTILFLGWIFFIGCSASVGKKDYKQMRDPELLVRGEVEFEQQTSGLPIGIKRAEELALDFQKKRYPENKRVVIGPVVGFNGKEYLLTSPDKNGIFSYRGILVDSATGNVTLKETGDGKMYKTAVWVHPFIWSGIED